MKNNYALQKKIIKKILKDNTISKNEKIKKLMSIKFYVNDKKYKKYSKKEALKLYNMNKGYIEKYSEKYKKNESKYILMNKNGIY